MARRSVRRRSRERHARRRRLRRGGGGDGVQVLRDRRRSAAVELVSNCVRADITEQGWLYWDRAAWFAPDRVRHVYEDLPSYQLIDSNIAHGNPVIVRVRSGSGITHFVVIAGKDGFDYLVRDPGAGSAKGLYPLRELGSDIEALRFYQPIANTIRTFQRSAELNLQSWRSSDSCSVLRRRKTPRTVSHPGRCVPVSVLQVYSVDAERLRTSCFRRAAG